MTSKSLLPGSHVGQMLGRLAQLLLILFAVTVAFDAYPLRLLQPDWILAFSATASNFLVIPWLGLGMAHLAGHIAPTTQRKLQRRAARLAALLALLFLLIQPLLAVAAYQSGVNLSSNNRQQAAAIQARGDSLVNAVTTATSFGQIQSRMTALQGPPILDESSSVPLPLLKRELLKSINDSQTTLLARLRVSSANVLPQLYKQVARTSVLSLIGALGFALLAWDPLRTKNIVFSYLASLGLPGLAPIPLRNRLRQATTKFRRMLRRRFKEATRRRRAQERAQGRRERLVRSSRKRLNNSR